MPLVAHSVLLALIALGAWVAPGEAWAQDVEMLGERYGTRPPPAYYREIARDRDAYRFARGRAGRIRAAPAGTGSAGAPGAGPLGALGPRGQPVVGDFVIPVLLGRFQDAPSTEPITADDFTEGYFGAGSATVSAYYDEVSGGRVSLDGAVMDWQTADLTRSEVTRGDGALSGATVGQGGIGNFVRQLLLAHIAAQPGLDWGQFDNDGPDGIPNSGDDDGYVDALAVVHPTRGAECTQDYGLIWSHKWSLQQAVGTSVATPTPSANGGFIRVDDYFVQPALSCTQSADRLNEIGIFTHETGHAFGLPDLYDTRSQLVAHAGAGNWDLMASGAWGCDNFTPEYPCHMGAWSKAMLGWVDVVDVPPGGDEQVVLPPVLSGGTVYRVAAQNGSDEYFLLENRRREGFDRNLYSEGMLVWQVDPVLVAARWGANVVNSHDRPGVRVRQADSREDLGTVGGGRGDAGDTFPYELGGEDNRVFHAGSIPAAVSYDGSATGVTIMDIERAGADVSFRLLTRFSAITLEAAGSPGAAGLFMVDGSPPRPSGHAFDAAPFATVRVEAAAGELLQPGLRRPFDRWADGLRPRIRNVQVPLEDTVMVALYDGREVELAVAVDGGEGGVVPGTLHSIPASEDLWFAEGRSISVEARPRTGFQFDAWSGALAGQDNPALVTMSAPVVAGASFTKAYAMPARTMEATATEPQDFVLETVNGSEPFTWSVTDGTLPEGLQLRSSGRITGAALETGTFELTVEARDAIGLVADGTVTVVVRRPDIQPARAAAPFLQAADGLTEAEEAFLDRRGNGDGRYDLGDFRAWLATRDAPDGGAGS